MSIPGFSFFKRLKKIFSPSGFRKLHSLVRIAVIGNPHIDFAPVRLPDGRLLHLGFELMQNVRPIGWSRLLEHVFDRKKREHTEQVILSDSRSLFVSNDLGATWKEIRVPIEDPEEQYIWGSFTTDAGWHLILLQDLTKQQTRRGTPEAVAKSICVYDEHWRLIKKIDAPGYLWHGNYSIDQRGDTIMYGEYPIDSPDGLAIRRSRDGGLTWKECFRAPTSAQSDEFPPETCIRHFHTCQADPWKPGRWYVSNGDALDKEWSSLWISEDDGETWKRSEHRIVNPEAFPEESRDVLNRAVLRMTPPIIGKDAIYSVTDDAFRYKKTGAPESSYLGSLFVKISKEAPHEITILDNFGQQAMRSCTKIDEDYYVAISESNRKEMSLNVVVFNLSGWSRLVGFVPLSSDEANAGPGTASSVSAKNGTFFTNGSRISLENGDSFSCVLKWNVAVNGTKTKPDTPNVSKKGCRLMTESIFYTEPGFTGCPICGGTAFEKYGNGENRLCSGCRSLERQRAFARIYEEYLCHEFDFTRKPMLHFAPTPSEVFLFSKLSRIKRVTADVLKSYHPDLLIDICDMRRIPDGSFGSVMAASVLEFVHDEEAALSELHRILCEGGRFFFSPAKMLYGVDTRTLVNPSISNYGPQAFDEHKVAYYRDYGDVDLLRLLQEYFVVKTFYAFDAPTATIQTWYCGIKSKHWSPRRTTSSTADVEKVDISEFLERKKIVRAVDLQSVTCDQTQTETGRPITWTCQAVGRGSLEYAWYLFRNDERIDIVWYTPQNTLTYTPTQPGKYMVQVYVQNEEEKRSVFSDAVVVR